MEKISHYCWVHLKNGSNLILIRVRWNSKKNSVELSAECNAEPEKWDLTAQRAQYNTTHKVNGRTFTAKQINNRINSMLEMIEEAFVEFGLDSIVPSTTEFKSAMEEKLGRIKTVSQPKVTDTKKDRSKKNFKQMFGEFLATCSSERNWAESVHYKYNQLWNQIHACDPVIKLSTIDKAKMLEIRDWFVENKYRNETTNKQFKMFKSFLRWLKGAGYQVNDSALEYKTNLVTVPKTVTYLNFTELMHFTNFQFPESKKYLDKARDMFVFMANTSLRVSDLRNLRFSHINNGSIELFTQKTHDRITVPLTDQARYILGKYKVKNPDPNATVFLVPSSQKLNDYIKEAAELAGLDRQVNFVYFIGANRYEETYKIHEIISNHMARRTFVVCSLSMGIPAEIVMQATGHKDYESMKPYIAICDDTQRVQMSKWNKQRTKSQIIEILDQLDHDELEQVLKTAKEVLVK